MNEYIDVGGRLHSIATGNVLAGANEVLDDAKGKKQSVINTETYTLVNEVNAKLDTLSPEQQGAMSVAAKANNNEAKLGYYECSTEANNAAKKITNASGYELSVGGSIKVKMINANTVDNATLEINSTEAKPLYYNGEQASASNTWEAGETLDIYYDGTNYYANNVAGGASDGVFDVSAKYPTSGVEGGNTYTLQGVITVLDNNLSANRKKGGMSIKFIQSSDNKYVEYLYNSTSTNADNFTNVDNWEKLNLEKEVDDLETSVNNLNNAVQASENDSLYITDKDGNVVAQIDDTGIKSIDFKDENGNSLVGAIADNKESIESTASDVEQIQHSVQDKEQEELDVTDIDGNIIIKVNEQGAESVDFIARGRHLKDAPLAWYEDTLYVTDSNGNVVAKIDANGLNVVNVEYFGKVSFDWIGKSIATYGDSVTAINNGDFEYPFSNTSNNWGNKVADYFKFAKHYGRGIGGQKYKWGSAGGSVCWVTPTGILINRLDSFNYDNWDGTTYPSGVTAEMEQQGTAIRIRGCLASWLRITKMFPADMKDSVDVVLVMAHNDSYDSNDCAFVENDTTDTEWAASGNDYYDKINGDYNLDTFKGAVASCIMKLQLWMPNAVIVLMSGISGQGVEGELNLDINNTSGLNKAEAIRNMSKLTSIPCIDTYATDGINGWNRLYYIADSVHPYTAYGKNMFARAVIGGLKCILPKDKVITN